MALTLCPKCRTAFDGPIEPHPCVEPYEGQMIGETLLGGVR